MSDDAVLPAFSLRPMIVVGSSWIEQEFITISIMPAKVILPVLSSSNCMAFIPLGVAALPSPSMLDDIFIAIYLFASLLLDRKRNLIIGSKSFASLSLRPLLSKMFISPSQTAYIPHKFIHSSRPVSDAVKRLETTKDGFLRIRAKTDKNIIKNQIIAMVYIYSLFLNIITR